MDGTSDSLLVVGAKRDIHWAGPEDIEWDPAGPFPKVGGFEKNDKFNAARADGSVTSFSSTAAVSELKNMLTISAGQTVDQSQLKAP